jgi:hypothetical protein
VPSIALASPRETRAVLARSSLLQPTAMAIEPAGGNASGRDLLLVQHTFTKR